MRDARFQRNPLCLSQLEMQRASGGAAPFLRVSLTISPTLRQQQSAAEEDVEERGRHVCSQRARSAQKSFLEVATSFFHQDTGELFSDAVH